MSEHLGCCHVEMGFSMAYIWRGVAQSWETLFHVQMIHRRRWITATNPLTREPEILDSISDAQTKATCRRHGEEGVD